MGYAGFFWFVFNGNGDMQYGYVFPSKADQDFYFEFEFQRVELDAADGLEGIKSIAGLGVGELDAGFESKPKVGEFMTKGGFSGDIILGHVACSDYHCAWIFFKTIEQTKHLGGRMLTIGIDGDGIFVAGLPSNVESLTKGIAFSTVNGITDEMLGGKLMGNVGSVVG